jgi:hypothetical protein
MALLDFESFAMSNYAPDYGTYGRVINNLSPDSSITPVGLYGDLAYGPAQFNPFIRRLMGTATGGTLGQRTTLIYGQRMRFAPFNSGQSQTLQFYDVVNGVPQVTVLFNPFSQQVLVYRGDASGTLLGASAIGVYPVNADFYAEVKCTIGSGTSGAVVVRIAEIVVLTLTGINTQNSARPYIDTTALYGNGTSWAYHMYWADTAGASPWNDFLGDVRVTGELANAAGYVSNFASGNANANWQNAAISPPNPSADYNYNSTVGHIDAYQTATPAGYSQIFGKMGSVILWEAGAGARSAQVGLYAGGTVAFGASTPCASSPTTLSYLSETDPSTGVAPLPGAAFQPVAKVAA